MSERKAPRVTLLAPGAPRSFKAPRGFEVEYVENDGGFGQAFSFGTVPPDEVKNIDSVPGAMVVHGFEPLHSARKQYVSLARDLKKAGALALRFEQSKAGWLIDAWLELISAGDAASVYRAGVIVLRGKKSMQSCGMHLFSLPDVMIDEGADSERILTALNHYQLDEDPVFLSGQTFSPDAKTARREVIRWPDLQYPASHSCHNPFGVWRLGAAAERSGFEPRKPMVFMPSLAAMLTAAESKKKSALTQKEVLALRDGAVCMAMEPADAQRHERARGYFDFEPELIWEQWSAYRTAR
ncbi:MAG: hypothetical protein QM817_20395 [Archangium sp.]